jgi:hypothetical protein
MDINPMFKGNNSINDYDSENYRRHQFVVNRKEEGGVGHDAAHPLIACLISGC